MKPVTQMLRAYTEPTTSYEKKPRKKKSEFERQLDDMEEVGRALGPHAWPWFGPTVVFDVETHTRVGQPLRFGIAQIRGHTYRHLMELGKKYKRNVPRGILDAHYKEVLFYEPGQCEEHEVECMRAYAGMHGMKFMAREEFVSKEFYRLYSIKSGRKGELSETLPCMVVGHNLPFDLGALSIRSGPSRDENYGGLTLILQKRRPGITIKKIGFGKHFYGVHQSQNQRRNHRFVDTMQLGRALLGASVGGSLDAIAKGLGIQDIAKGGADYDGPITAEYIDYCRNDVELTWQTYVKLRELYNKHALSTPIERIFSEASIGKGYLNDLGIDPFLEKNPSFDRRLCGLFMASMYGGRSEVRWRHEIKEGLQADFKSQYPTVNALMKLQRFNIADRVAAVESKEAIQFLQTVSLQELQKPETWPKLCGVALVRPKDGDILPVRTVYEKDIDQDGAPLVMSMQQIGDNEIQSGPPAIWTFSDIIASKIRTGRCPEIIQATVLLAKGTQDGLKPKKYFGDERYNIDLTRDDLFQRFIDVRSTIKNRPDFKTNPELGPMEQGIKLCANASAYGALVQFDIDERKKKQGTWVYYGSNKMRKTARAKKVADDGREAVSGYKVEKPGKWFAPWGPLIPAGGRLLLAIAEQLGLDRGIRHAFADTDSMFFVRPDGMERGEFYRRVREIAGPNGWFQALNPYSADDPVFSIEDVNFKIKQNGIGKIVRNAKGGVELEKGSIEPLYFLGVSAKRYALANRSNDGGWIIRKASGHGLAHITAPNYTSKKPYHPAAPFEVQKDQTSPLWFGIQGVWKEGELCHGRNPRLFCDLWRIAFETADAYTSKDGDFEGYLRAELRDALKGLAGLGQEQMLQTAVSTRDEWLTLQKLPAIRAFMFFNMLPKPESNAFFSADNFETKKSRDDLLKTSFYTSGGRDVQVLTLSAYREKGQGREGLYRRDNNHFPEQMFDEQKYGLHFQTISEALDDYFTHAETKSIGERGFLERQKLVILDQEYIGKETNSLIDEDILEAQEMDHDDLPVVRLTRDALNLDLLKSFGAPALSTALGVSQDAVRKRLFQNSRFSDKTMARLRASMEVDDDGKTRLVPQPFATEEEKTARRVQRQLQLMNARSSGPLSLQEIEDQIGAQLTNRDARRALRHRLPLMWEGRPLIKDQLSDQIVKAIAKASGAELAEAKKTKRAGTTPRDRQNAERVKRTKRARERRFAPFQTLESQLSPDEASFGDELMEIVLRELLSKHGVPFTHEAAGAFYREHGPEVLSALKSTMTHTTVDNAVLEAQAFFDDRLAKREIRKEKGRLRVARHRKRARVSNDANQPIDSGVKNAAGDSSLGDDGAK
jgi:DNA polymerase III epsilon subunit-like protein